MDNHNVIMLLLCSTICVAVYINRIQVPTSVEEGTEFVILDCEYMIPSPAPGLVIKWFFNGSSSLVYQWIPPHTPQVIGLLKGKVDASFRISDEPLQAYRAMKILNPSTKLSGTYTCVVSTFMDEDRQTQHMLVYSTGSSLQFFQEKSYVFIVTLKCVTENLYPKPNITIYSQRNDPLKQTVTEITLNSRGLYDALAFAVVHDDEVLPEGEQFLCTLTLPPTNYSANRTTIYYPGFMPTAKVAVAAKPSHRLLPNTSRCSTSDYILLLYAGVILIFIIIM